MNKLLILLLLSLQILSFDIFADDSLTPLLRESVDNPKRVHTPKSEAETMNILIESDNTHPRTRYEYGAGTPYESDPNLYDGVAPWYIEANP